MTIRELAYELYKMDWMRRISCSIQMDTLKDYYQETTEEDREEYTFEDYILEYGYSGQLYACYEEFLGEEYFDKAYVRSLFNNNELFAEYQQDLNAYEIKDGWASE